MLFDKYGDEDYDNRDWDDGEDYELWGLCLEEAKSEAISMDEYHTGSPDDQIDIVEDIAYKLYNRRLRRSPG